MHDPSQGLSGLNFPEGHQRLFSKAGLRSCKCSPGASETAHQLAGSISEQKGIIGQYDSTAIARAEGLQGQMPLMTASTRSAFSASPAIQIMQDIPFVYLQVYCIRCKCMLQAMQLNDAKQLPWLSLSSYPCRYPRAYAIDRLSWRLWPDLP